MTWALSKAAYAFAISLSARNTLKVLKAFSKGDDSFADYSDEAYSILMFWSIHGFFMVWEYLFEYFVTWIPGYFYFKSALILLIAFPKVRIVNLVFSDLMVPILERCYENLRMEKPLPSALEMVSFLPWLVLITIFPIRAITNSVEINLNDEVTDPRIMNAVEYSDEEYYSQIEEVLIENESQSEISERLNARGPMETVSPVIGPSLQSNDISRVAPPPIPVAHKTIEDSTEEATHFTSAASSFFSSPFNPESTTTLAQETDFSSNSIPIFVSPQRSSESITTPTKLQTRLEKASAALASPPFLCPSIGSISQTTLANTQRITLRYIMKICRGCRACTALFITTD